MTLTLAIPQFRPRKGDLQGNLDRVGALLAQCAALEPAPRVVVFAETVLSGYFLEGGVRDVALTAESLAAELDARWRASGASGAGGAGRAPVDVIIGFYELVDGNLHNSAACIALREDAAPRILHVHRKNFLPTYSLFDEERFVERGYGIRAFDTSWGRVALLVCEDAWHSLSGTIAALDGAQVVFVLAAAPARGPAPRDDRVPGPGSVERWERLIRDIAEEQGIFCVLANLVGSEGGRMFQGGSMIAGPRGDVRARAPVFDEAILTATLELSDLARVRADLPLLSDLRAALPFLRTELDRTLGIGRVAVEEGDATSAGATPSAATAPSAPSATSKASAKPAATRAPRASVAAAEPLPVVHGGAHARGTPPALDIDARLVETWLVAFLRDEFARRGFTKAIVGVSGGVDSAVVATLAARALGPRNVIGVRMPYRTSSPDSLSHAQLLIDQLGIEGRTLEITGAVDGYLALEPDADAARRGNVMARTRMIALFDLSAKHRALPLGTGNKSERLLGYFTWHADDSPPVNPIGDLFKTQVWALATWLGVPDEIVRKPASADLIAGQTDEADFGVSYAVADEVLNWILHGWSAAELEERGMDAAAIALVKSRLDSTHWKRKLPTVAMLSGAAIGESYLRPVDL
ncbi:MAG: NAD+ synthase [Gemmatimonadetes bacterium]|nr:NAD+ synthase [Gemmatimonadota bacterium]